MTRLERLNETTATNPMNRYLFNLRAPVQTEVTTVVTQLASQGITDVDKLPKAARDYLSFIEKESGARIGMVSTGPGRDETMFAGTFAEELNSVTDGKSRAQKRS